MNVLVYEGPGVSRTSLANTVSSLRTLLSPHYAVQTASADTLISQPWSKSCALLVIPGGRDLPYVSALSRLATSAIKRYVHDGGSFLGICAGAYFASAKVEWEMGTALEVSGRRPLGFFNGICKGSVYPGFSYDSEGGAHAIDLSLSLKNSGPSVIRGLYFNGGGEFIGVRSSPLTSVLATYTQQDTPEKVAAVHCRVGKGSVVLWGVHIEFSLLKEPLVGALAKRLAVLSPAEVAANETHRWQLLRNTLSLLSLHIPLAHQPSNTEPPTSPLPQLLTSTAPTLPSEIYEIMRKSSSQPPSLEDASDTFTFYQSDSASNLIQDARENPAQLDSPRAILLFEHGTLPPPELTPEFQIKEYYFYLAAERSSCHNSVLTSSQPWGLGQLLIYGEAVTSTQTMLDKNPVFIRSLPAPLLSLATYQLSGRGRGGNVWVSPPGCLQFSLLLRAPLSQLPGSQLVFIQYLFGIAVINACRQSLGAAGERVRLKWPNDIYAVLDTFDEFGRKNGQELKKLGGILVTTHFSKNEVDIVVGCGLNILNRIPTISLSQLARDELRLEKVAACIMTSFETVWTRFLANQGSFAPFLETYLDYWLHSDQLVTLSTVAPPISVRIVGITLDFGLLRTIPDDNFMRGFIDLQPDGNSFDMMAGLIKRKTVLRLNNAGVDVKSTFVILMFNCENYDIFNDGNADVYIICIVFGFVSAGGPPSGQLHQVYKTKSASKALFFEQIYLMDTLQIYRTPSAVTLRDAQDKICFAIEASFADNMYHLSVRSVTQCCPSIGPYPDFWHEEIAKIVWNCDTPFIILRESKFDIDTFMRSDGLFDSSRVFVGPGDVLLRWKIRPWAVELRNNSTGLLIARWRPHQNRIKSLFSKGRGTVLEINSLYNKDTNMRNAIVLTWIIIDGLLLRREQNYNNSNNTL